MSFWTWLNNTRPNSAGEVANDNPESSVGPGYRPGDPDQLDLSDFENIPEGRTFPIIQPSPWSGWPDQWSTPNFNAQAGIRRLIDIAWGALDINASIISSMPVYRLRNGEVVDSTSWMINPDPDIYTSWQEFAKQVFWDYMLGEAFILPMATGSDGYPIRFRVIPPWLMTVEMRGGTREYHLGSANVTGSILHIRYNSTIDHPRGQGPLEQAGARMTTIGLLERYTNHLAETGGVPLWWMEVERRINPSEGRDLLETWIESRAKYAGYPAVVGSGAKLNQARAMSAHDMTLLELQQFNEARIAVLIGVPPFLLGLPGSSGHLTYANIESLFSGHERTSLRPKVNAVVSAISGWALPRGQSIELNRDEYTRPGLLDRSTAYKNLIDAKVLSPEEARIMERLYGTNAPIQVSGGAD